jgi:hypothetical protein
MLQHLDLLLGIFISSNCLVIMVLGPRHKQQQEVTSNKLLRGTGRPLILTSKKKGLKLLPQEMTLKLDVHVRNRNA